MWRFAEAGARVQDTPADLLSRVESVGGWSVQTLFLQLQKEPPFTSR